MPEQTHAACFLFDMIKYYEMPTSEGCGGFPCLRWFMSATTEGDALVFAERFLRQQQIHRYPPGNFTFVNRQPFIGSPGQGFALRYGSGMSMQEAEQARALGYFGTGVSL